MVSSDEGQARGSFRIDDELYLEYQALPGGEEGGWDQAGDSLCEGLLRLRELTLQSSHILANIRKQHHDIALYLSLLDRKIDVLAQLLGGVIIGERLRPNTRVNIGADGMSFLSSVPLTPQDALGVRLVLFPANLCLRLRARVVRSEEQAEGHRVAILFEQISEVEREALIRHLLEKQSASLRRERGE